MLISIIATPPDAPQRYVPAPQPPPTPRLDPLDQSIVEAVRETGRIKLWSLLNRLAEDEGSQSRAKARATRLSLLARVRRLKRAQFIFGVGRNEVTTTKLVREPVRRRPGWRSASVGRMARFEAVSGVSPALSAQHPEIHQSVDFEVFAKDMPAPTAPNDAAKSESATTPEQASEAGRKLASLPRKQQRKWTGWLHGEHCWRRRPVVLPNGEVTTLYWANRGRVLLTDANDLPYRSWLLRVARREQDVRLYQHPAAVALGHLKAGVKETPSALKQASCRRNGCLPCAPGKRRGRPRKALQPAKPDPQQSIRPAGPMTGTLPPMDYTAAVAFFSQPRT